MSEKLVGYIGMRKRLVETLRDIGIAGLDDYERFIRADERAKLREAILAEIDKRCCHTIEVGPMYGQTHMERCILLSMAREAVAAVFDKEG